MSDIYRPPRGESEEHSDPPFDPEGDSRFTNWATALSVAALCATAGSAALTGKLGWLTAGKGSDVGIIFGPVMVGIVALTLLIFVQQIGSSIPRGSRTFVLGVLAVTAVLLPLAIFAA